MQPNTIDGTDEIDVGVLVDDQGVVAAKFEQKLAHACGDAFCNLTTDTRMSR